MKTKALRLLTLPLLFGMCACSDMESGTYFMCITENTKTSISKSYEKFTGYSKYRREFKVDVTLSVVTTTTSGNLLLEVSEENSPSICKENLTEDATYTFVLPKGKYIFYVEGNEHSGSYKFSWADKN